MRRHLSSWTTLGFLMMLDGAPGRTTELHGLAYNPPPSVGKTRHPTTGSSHRAKQRVLKDLVLPPLSAPISFSDPLPVPPVAAEWPSLDVSATLIELLSQPCMPSPLPLRPSRASIRCRLPARLWDKVRNAIKIPRKGKS